MKSINFRRGTTMLRTQQEKKPVAKKKTNYDRVVYFVVLFLILGSLAYYVFNKFLYVKANGQVLLDNLMIRLTEDSRILKIFKAEGDSIHEGDSLFLYFVEARANQLLGISDTSSNISEKNSSTGRAWVEREIFNIQTKIALNKIDITENSKLLSKKQGELLRIKNQVMLDALPHSRLEAAQNETDKMRTDILKLQMANTELALLAEQLNDPEKMLKPDSAVNKSSTSATGMMGLARVFIAPVGGIVNRLFKSEYETALRTDDILSIQRRDKIFIKAFFEQKDIDDFREEDIVKVKFPDGTISKGVIKRLYLGTYDMPEEFQKKYEPAQRTVAADVYPLDSAQSNQWKFFHKMNAEITKFKF